MDLTLSAEQLQLRDATRRLLTERLAALVAQLPSPSAPVPGHARADAHALGWLGLGLPEDLGGAGTFEDLAIVHEELGRGLAPSLVTTLGIAGRLLLHLDPSPRRDQLLSELAAGSVVVAVGLEPGVRLTGGVVEGSQRHVVDAHAASCFLLAVDDGGTDRVALVDAADVALDDEPGMADAPQCRLTVTGLPARILGVLPDVVRTEAAVLAAARAVGGGRAVLARTVDHVRTRHQFDRPIGTFQAVQHQLADVATALDAAGLAVARAVWAVEAAPDQLETAAGIAAVAARKAFAAATLVAHQLHGGMGFVLDSPLHLWSARAVADPTAPPSPRLLLQELAASLGLATDGVQLPPQHRAS